MTIGFRHAGLPRDKYGAALARTALAGTCKTIMPFSDRRLRRSLAVRLFVVRVVLATEIS
ncbi:MAG TPA: hypothetical protein VHZ97_05840 [Pseudonocardiaceae bacterium]|nr:hypothetical protein [Pseudonocardiaceae bacterium]